MNQRAQYLIQILDKIGGPLLEAAEQAGNDAETATIVASLLGKVVETSITMNQTLDLTASDSQDDSLRVALAALAGSLVANQYKQKGKVPEATDLSRVQSAMSAVLTFADNFTLSPEHITRLEKLKADGGVVDAHQISIQYIDALIPVINAVGAFPFGQPEQKLIMDVSDRLVKRTAEMRETLLPDLSGDDEKLAELAILRATASVYAACHEAETQRLTGSDTEAPATLSIDPVWKAFETRTAMLESVAKNLMPQSSSTSKANVAPEQADPAAPLETPTIPAPPATSEQPPAASNDSISAGETDAPAVFQSKPEQAAPPPSQEETQPAKEAAAPTPPPSQPSPPPATEPAQTEQASGGGSPMGFFAKPGVDTPPAEDKSVSPPMAQQPEAPPPAVETPPPPPAAPPAPTPPPQPEAEEGDDDSSKGGDSGGNPMSFFGKKD